MLVCNCWGFTLQMLGGSEVVADFVLREEVVYVPAPISGKGYNKGKTFKTTKAPDGTKEARKLTILLLYSWLSKCIVHIQVFNQTAWKNIEGKTNCTEDADSFLPLFLK